MKTMFITGITGFLGRYFAKQALKSGYRVIGLVRPKPDMLPEERIESIFGANNIEVVEGDVREPKLGLPSSLESRIASEVNEIWHFAGLTSFDERKEQELIDCNLNGTINVLTFAEKACNLSFLAHISTAYVCGDRQGVVYETELFKGQGFHNFYEESKLEAEKLVHEYSVKSIIFRPSVVVGDSKTGETSSFQMVYIPWMGVYLAKKSFMKKEKIQENGAINLPLRIVGNDSATLNIIPVDTAVGMMLKLGIPENVGKTFHITNPEYTTLGDLRQAICDASNVTGVRYVPNLETENNLNFLEKFYLMRTKPYQAYMLNNDPVFDMANSGKLVFDIPKPDRELMQRLINYGIEKNWGR
jgi:nucleoside-diphosphate-sugar epimerase